MVRLLVATPSLAVVFAVFGWCSAAEGTYKDPHFFANRTVIVELFEWTWSDIGQECVEFLGPHGYGAVQVSPPNENAFRLYTVPGGESVRTWYERYEPVSYTVSSPSGEKDEFAAMVKKCREAGVRVYVDAVLNHMTSDIGEGEGYAESRFDAHTYSYDGVPYRANEFHSLAQCGTTSGRIEDYSNVVQVRNCKYEGRADLDHSQETVRQKTVSYLNDLVSLGVAGFRIDSASYMWPEDLRVIYRRISNLDDNGTRPFIYQEISAPADFSSSDYAKDGCVTKPLFYKKIVNVLKKVNQATLKELKADVTLLPSSDDSVVYVDSHEIQRGIDVNDFDNDAVNYQERRTYVLANVLMLAQPHGMARVMSSYAIDRKMEPFVPPRLLGPPSDHAFNTLPVLKKANYECYNGWICEHRWLEIRGMVQFRNAVGSVPVTAWWDDDADAIAFARQGKGFVVINNGRSTLNTLLNTTLPEGYYCDVLSGEVTDQHHSACSGRTVRVRRDSYAHFIVNSDSDVPAVAIHIHARVFPDI
ncbi:alpha-amylase-like [Ornithodoros turicata]|uniref:alpha-amylase-like n=1 Tax=Ornithodoros turicata TaxID=34597 RepID=UPI0031387D3A